MNLDALRRGTALLLALAMMTLAPVVQTARAEMVTTEAALSARVAPAADAARDKVEAFFERAEVRAELGRLGVSEGEAKLRLAALSDAEVLAIAGRVDRVPAGGSSFGSVLAIAAIVFIVLIVTDAMGLTDIFPWVNSANQRN